MNVRIAVDLLNITVVFRFYSIEPYAILRDVSGALIRERRV